MSFIPVADEAMRKRILSELDLNENRLKDDVVRLRDWANLQPHLPQNISDNLLKSFILGTKGIEFAKERLDRYFAVRNVHTIIFTGRDPTTFNKTEAVEQFLLPQYTKEGYLVYMIRIRPDSTSADFDHLQVIRRQLLYTDYFLDKGMYSSGIVGVYEMQQATAGHLAKFNVSHNMAIVKSLQDNFPLRIRKVILLNFPSYAIKFFENLIRPILKKKLSQKIVVIASNDRKAVREHLPDCAMPSDYGGDAVSCAQLNAKSLALLEKERDWCLSSQEMKTDESKRIEKRQFDFNQGFGIEGTFRSLALD